MMDPISINFVTSSTFKHEENKAFVRSCSMPDGAAISDCFEFELIPNDIAENLEVELAAMVTSEAKAAYSQLRRPCIVEHAGLIFTDYKDSQYPGGLTKPMWNTLGEDFLNETHSAGRTAEALAVIGYCDGQKIWTFSASTEGSLSDAPRGSREFYWDTIFVPKDDNPDNLTYAEIVETHGLEHKMRVHSQSAKAMLAFLTWRIGNKPPLWDVTF
jgi:inosine/xanthosine triphosphate pyrophosphatase family protein